MGRFRFRSRVLAAVGFPLAAFATFLALYFPSMMEESSTEALVTRANGLAQVLSKLVAPALEMQDLKKTIAALDSVKGDADIRYVTVLTVDDIVFAHWDSKGHGKNREIRHGSTENENDFQGGLLHVRVPLSLETTSGDVRVLGTLVSGFSMDAPKLASQKASHTALVVTLIIFGFGGLLAWVFSGNIARPLMQTSRRLNTVAIDLMEAARAREKSAAKEAAAVEQTRRTMDMLLTSAEQISESASDVLAHAERTQTGNMAIALRIDELNHHAEKVAELLAGIMQVADRADLLALNAAVEGTRAGKAGGGFLMVATEMRRLAETVTSAVDGIQRVLQQVRNASMEAVKASLSGTESSAQTTQSVRDIAGVTEQQRLVTLEVSASMDEMTTLLNQAMTDIKYTNKSARALSGVSDGLSRLINPTLARTRRLDRDGPA